MKNVIRFYDQNKCKRYGVVKAEAGKNTTWVQRVYPMTDDEGNVEGFMAKKFAKKEDDGTLVYEMELMEARTDAIERGREMVLNLHYGFYEAEK